MSRNESEWRRIGESTGSERFPGIGGASRRGRMSMESVEGCVNLFNGRAGALSAVNEGDQSQDLDMRRGTRRQRGTELRDLERGEA